MASFATRERPKLAALGAAIASTAMLGCGGGHGPEPNPEPPSPAPSSAASGKATCSEAFVGTPAADWRQHSTARGPIGFFGPDRNFLYHPSKRTKSPVILEGEDPVTVSIARGDRSHAGLLVVSSGPYVRVRFVPCPGQARTGWPAGFLLRDYQPVSVVITQAGKQPMHLIVGRI